MKTLRGKCPQCCPDGGACFTRHGAAEKKCNNCHLILPFRRIKATDKSSKSQQREINRITNLGWEVTEQSFIGRKTWVTFRHPTRGWFLGDTVYGTIGVRGQLSLTLLKYGPEKLLHDDIDIKVYLG